MAEHVVVDTNIWGHTSNPVNKYWVSAVTYITTLESSDLVLAFDNTSGGEPHFDKSILYVEYQKFVRAPGIANQIFNLLVSQSRFVFYDRLGGANKLACKQLVPRNHKDEVILGVAFCAPSKLLVSNDYDDFHKKARKQIRQKLGVTVVDSDQAVAL